MAASKMNWTEIDTDALKGQARKAHLAWKAANAKATELRKEFEETIRPKVASIGPKGTIPIFSYRFGKVSVAFTEPEAQTKASTSNKLVL